MEIDSSVKRVNDSNLEEIGSATQQKRVKTMFETLEWHEQWETISGAQVAWFYICNF